MLPSTMPTDRRTARLQRRLARLTRRRDNRDAVLAAAQSNASWLLNIASECLGEAHADMDVDTLDDVIDHVIDAFLAHPKVRESIIATDLISRFGERALMFALCSVVTLSKDVLDARIERLERLLAG